MIFIIDIDCCVFFWFQGAFFFGGMGLRRWGLAFEGQVGFGRLDRFFLVGWSGSSGTVYWVYGLSRVWQELTLKYIEIYWNHWRSLRRSVCSWRPSSTMGRSETVQRCKSQQEVGGEIPRKWNVYAVCDLYVFYMVFWFEHGLILGFFPFKQNTNFSEQKKPMILQNRGFESSPGKALLPNVQNLSSTETVFGGSWDFPRLGPLLCFLWSTPEIQRGNGQSPN